MKKALSKKVFKEYSKLSKLEQTIFKMGFLEGVIFTLKDIKRFK